LNEESGLGNRFRSSSEKIAKTIAEANESAITGAKTVKGVLRLERVSTGF
jgi:hypothetical protein